MPADNHRLFFALKPIPQVAERIARAAESALTLHQARVRWTASAKYHLTLHFLGNHAGAPHPVIDCAKVAAQSLVANAFGLTLDRIECFPGRRQVPFIVRCSRESESPLFALRLMLGESLAAAGLAGLLEDRFTPHVTIGYGPAADAMPVAIAPVTWPVTDFVLMQSRAGQAEYDTLGRWPLRTLSVRAGGSAPDNGRA